MFRHSISQFDQELLTIHPGEYFATLDDSVISTVLGSCVAVGIFDPALGAGGLNHFMLPGEYRKSDLLKSPNAKYGMYAMELLINDLMKLGADRRSLRAKVFGGGAVLRLPGGGNTRIPDSNIDFAFEYLAKEGIPVEASDVGGRLARKIFFFARTGRVLLKRVGGELVEDVEREDGRYFKELSARRPEGPITLFGQGDGRDRGA